LWQAAFWCRPISRRAAADFVGTALVACCALILAAALAGGLLTATGEQRTVRLAERHHLSTLRGQSAIAVDHGGRSRPEEKPMIVRGDARRIPLRDETVQCTVTSPPYCLHGRAGRGLQG